MHVQNTIEFLLNVFEIYFYDLNKLKNNLLESAFGLFCVSANNLNKIQESLNLETRVVENELECSFVFCPDGGGPK